MNTPKEQLGVFVQKVDRLLAARFARDVLNQKIEWRLSWAAGKGGSLDYPGCDADDRDGFLLTFRLFIQDNDAISVRNVSALMESLNLPATIIDPWRHSRKQLNDFLDSRPIFSALGEPKSYRELMLTLLYGDLSHLDPKYRPVFERWLSDELIWSNMQTMFFITLANFLSCLSVLKILAKMALDELGKRPS